MNRDDAVVAATLIVAAALIALLTAAGAVLAIVQAARGDWHLFGAYALFTAPTVAVYGLYRWLRRV